MEGIISLRTPRFTQAREFVRRNHPYPEEIAGMDLDLEIDDFLHQLEEIDREDLQRYAASIRNSQLELIFHALARGVSDRIRERLFLLLSIRIKKRFFHYCWILLQDHYSHRMLIEAFDLLCVYMREKYPREYSQSLAGQLNGFSRDVIHQILCRMGGEGEDLLSFFHHFRIVKESRMAKDLVTAYFQQCTDTGFQSNALLFQGFVEQADTQIYSVIRHYLDVTGVLDYIPVVNAHLLERYPFAGDHRFWDQIEEHLQDKLKAWDRIRQLESILGTENQKFLFWREYYHVIQEVSACPEQGILLIHLPGLVVVDFQRDRNRSYLYKRLAFEETLRAFQRDEEGALEWPLALDTVVSVKDAILDGIHGDIYSFTYERVGKLYIRELLKLYQAQGRSSVSE